MKSIECIRSRVSELTHILDELESQLTIELTKHLRERDLGLLRFINKEIRVYMNMKEELVWVLNEK